MTRRIALALALATLAACRSLPIPPRGSHAGDEPVTVPTMPPPGKVEVVVPPPEGMKHPVWIDGEWLWTGRRWQWKAARWEDAPPDMYFAPSETVRLKDGSLAHYRGGWTKEAAK